MPDSEVETIIQFLTPAVNMWLNNVQLLTFYRLCHFARIGDVYATHHLLRYDEAGNAIPVESGPTDAP